jgi:hypothetical protein
MKNFFSTFLDFVTGGFFNYIGALLRKPFSKKTYAQLLQENTSNNVGMIAFGIPVILILVYYKMILSKYNQ